MSGADVSKSNKLIRGIHFIHGVALISMIDTGQTHSFIYLECFNKMKLEVSSMSGSMVIDTPTNGLVTTLLVCLNCPLTIFGKDFGMDLVYLPLIQLDVILGMNWLEFNRVYISCFDKTVLFPEPGESANSIFMSAGQVDMSLREDDLVLVMFAYLRVESDVVASDMPVVCEFPDVFLEDIDDLPPKREVEFAIDLVPSTRLV